MESSLLEYFTDPVLRGPTVASMLMCFSVSLIGVFIYLRKLALIGETLSHAAYPGVVLASIAAAFWLASDLSPWLEVWCLIGAFLSCLLGMGALYFLEKRVHFKTDASLGVVLSLFFGFGVLLASFVQFRFTSFYKQAQMYLYGQAATLSDVHILLYTVLSLAIVLAVSLFYKEFKLATFDPAFARLVGVPVLWMDALFYILLLLAIVLGLRSVGVVLISAMLVAPSVAARAWTNRLSSMLIIAALIGVFSGLFGTILSNEISYSYQLSFPTGPSIILISSLICFVSLLFAPVRAFVHTWRFRNLCLAENVLKAMSKEGLPLSFHALMAFQPLSRLRLAWILHGLKRQGYITKTDGPRYALTNIGEERAVKIIRLHRLWEVYLVDYVGVSQSDKVEKSAGEMEHIITPEIEHELKSLIDG